MDPLQQNNPPVNPAPGSGAPQPEAPKKQYGPMIGIIIIIALLALGGLYFYGMQLMQSDTQMEDTQTTEESDAITTQLQMQSSSDEVDAIEADLEATSIESLDSGAEEFEGELQAQ